MRLADWDREFRTWNYAFGYSQLLLRSTPEFDSDKRVDVLFSNVRRMNVPSEFSGLVIDEGDFASERERLGISSTPSEPFKLFILNGGDGYVLATHCDWHEDNEWVDAPSRFGPFRGVK
ncbi:hypothetical protein J7E97_30140 [Streptomyces sp. ISL-66]|uniref:hypothetical protein n=1 Tax=Streptomyces sp. ISL-66 TaxID=2819186 RepID=UPI001BE7354D|nr:hypothetical protein [Streptomyces sp. ISL-66]MBT2472007.1 hypothetical protein [Streptomyces sp. ISL-66]